MSTTSVDAGDAGAPAADAAVLAHLTDSAPEGATGATDGEEAAAPPASFADLGLPREVAAALDDMGYFTPTPVQSAVYQKVMEGKDLMVQSRTGTGKTTAFGLPIVSAVETGKRAPQAIILTPTRELALQVSRELGMLSKHKGLAVETIYGGAPIGKQIDALRQGVHVVVGTPGRVLDHIGRRTLDLKGVRFFVLDECDEMLSMGFLEDIERIAQHVPKDRQTLLFSATMPDEVRRYSKRQMREPEHVALSSGNISVEEIHHAYYIVSGVARARDLLRILAHENPESAIIFCNTRDETGMVARFLQKQGLDAEALSSDLSQSDRERVMKRMKAKNLRFLVATDVAARGIDILELSHVINYSFPDSAEVYVHRTGRTGRAGKKGTALSLIGPRELGSFWYLKMLYKIQPEERDLPPASVLEGVLKAPLPRVGPPPPDPLATLRGVVSGTPTEEHLALARRVLAEADAETLVALLAGAKVDEVNAAKAAARAAAEAARKEREDRDRAERTERYGDRDERPRWGRDRDGDRPRRDGDRPRFREDGDRPRFRDRDREEGDRPRAREEGDRPRFREDGDRPRFRDRDRPRGERPEHGDRPARGERPEHGDRPARGERPEPGDRPARGERPESGDRPARSERAEQERGERPERDRGERPERDRDRGEHPERDRDRDRDRGERPDRERGDRGDRPERERTDRPERDRGERGDRPERERTERPDRERGDRPDRERGDRPERERTERPDRERGDRPERSERDRFRDERAERFERAAERVEREERAAREARARDEGEAPKAVEVAARDEERPARPEREDRDRGRRGRGRDRDRDREPRAERASDRPTEDAERPAAAAAPAPAPAKSKNGAAAAETRDFWETWADEKSTREPAPAPTREPRAEARRDDADDGPREGARRGRGRDRKRDEEPREGRRERGRTGERKDEPAPAPAAPAIAVDPAQQVRLHVNLGKKHGVSADDIRRLLGADLGDDAAAIGSVAMRDTYCHVRVPSPLAQPIIDAMTGKEHGDVTVKVELART